MNLARVTAYHPETGKVDLLFLTTNRRVPGVRVMAEHASSHSGRAGQATPDGQTSGDPYAVPAAGARAVIACVAFYDGTPVVQGFLHGTDSEILFPDSDRVMDRTPSDFYHTVDGKGNAEWYHPSGAFVRIATDPAHEDLAGKDFQGKFKLRRNTGNKVHIHIEQAGGVASVDIDPDGKVMVLAQGGASLKAPDLLVDVDDSRFTGNVSIDGGLKVGEGVDVGEGVNAAGDVVGKGVSLSGHVHTKVKLGTDKSGPPG